MINERSPATQMIHRFSFYRMSPRLIHGCPVTQMIRDLPFIACRHESCTLNQMRLFVSVVPLSLFHFAFEEGGCQKGEVFYFRKFRKCGKI